MALPARISIATLGVSDLARSTKFYLALGWELAPGLLVRNQLLSHRRRSTRALPI